MCKPTASTSSRTAIRSRRIFSTPFLQYVSEGESELNPEKLPGLLNVKYGSSSDGVRELGGNVRDVQRAFRGFQGKLYSEERKQ